LPNFLLLLHNTNICFLN